MCASKMRATLLVFFSMALGLVNGSVPNLMLIVNGTNENVAMVDIEHNVIAIANQEKQRAFCTNVHLGVISNCADKVFVLVDFESQRALIGKNTAEFKREDGSVDYGKLTQSLDELFTSYGSIGPNTKDSFDFRHLTEAFSDKEFDVATILKDSPEVVKVLKHSFGPWLQSAQQLIESGRLNSAKPFWAFLAAGLPLNINCNILILKVVEYLNYLSNLSEPVLGDLIDYILNFSRLLRKSISFFKGTFNRLDADTSVAEFDRDIHQKKFNITLFGVGYALTITRANAITIIHVFEKGKTPDDGTRIVYFDDVSIIHNLHNKAVLISKSDRSLLLNLNSNCQFLASNSLKFTRVRVLHNNNIADAIKKGDFLATIDEFEKEALEDEELLKNGTIAFSKLHQAMVHNDNELLRNLLNSKDVDDVLLHYKEILVKVPSGSQKGIIVAVLNNNTPPEVMLLTQLIHVAGTKNKIIQALLETFQQIYSEPR